MLSSFFILFYFCLVYMIVWLCLWVWVWVRMWICGHCAFYTSCMCVRVCVFATFRDTIVWECGRVLLLWYQIAWRSQKELMNGGTQKKFFFSRFYFSFDFGIGTQTHIHTERGKEAHIVTHIYIYKRTNAVSPNSVEMKTRHISYLCAWKYR